jgi:hypothetical protein
MSSALEKFSSFAATEANHRRNKALQTYRACVAILAKDEEPLTATEAANLTVAMRELDVDEDGLRIDVEAFLEHEAIAAAVSPTRMAAAHAEAEVISKEISDLQEQMRILKEVQLAALKDKFSAAMSVKMQCEDAAAKLKQHEADNPRLFGSESTAADRPVKPAAKAGTPTEDDDELADLDDEELGDDEPI